MASTATRSVLIEFGEEAAGVLIESEHGKFKFHVVHPRLMHLHGVEYRSVQAAQSSVRLALKNKNSA